MGLCKIIKDCYKTDFYCHYCNIFCLYFASVYYINRVKNRNKATKITVFDSFLHKNALLSLKKYFIHYLCIKIKCQCHSPIKDVALAF